MPEVLVVVRRDRHVTVVVDKAVARTYVKINAMIDRINQKWFFGEPVSVTIRDDVPPQEMRTILQASGVLYARDDVLDR